MTGTYSLVSVSYQHAVVTWGGLPATNGGFPLIGLGLGLGGSFADRPGPVDPTDGWIGPFGQAGTYDLYLPQGGTGLSLWAVAEYGTGSGYSKVVKNLIDLGSISIGTIAGYVAPPPPPPSAPPAPSTPSGFTIADNVASLTASWQAVTGHSGSTLHYEVSRGGLVIATTTDTSYVDTTAGAGRPLSYQVAAVNTGDGTSYIGSAYSGYASFTTNRAPLAPTLNGPSNNASLDLTTTQRFSWTPSDIDVNDSQSRFDLRYSADAGVTWTTVTGATPNQYLDIPSGTFVLGSYQWQVRTYDSHGLVGPYSSSGFFSTAQPPPGPAITFPVSGSTEFDNVGRIDWSAPVQQAYQVQRVASLPDGSADASTVYWDSGQVVDTLTRSIPLAFPVNLRNEHLRLRIEADGLWSPWTDEQISVSWVPPAIPFLTVTADQDRALIVLSWVVAGAVGDTPDANYVDVWMSTDGGHTSIRVATALLPHDGWTYYTPASGVSYTFKVVAFAANGTSSHSAWVATTSLGFGFGAFGVGAFGGNIAAGPNMPLAPVEPLVPVP